MNRLAFVAFSIPLLFACGPVLADGHSVAMDTQRLAMANPAATHCIDSGGRYEIRQSSAGAVGICILPDGTEVDAWEHFRAQTANPAAVFCVESGGHYQMRKEASDTVGICTLPDGTEIDAWEFFRAQKS